VSVCNALKESEKRWRVPFPSDNEEEGQTNSGLTNREKAPLWSHHQRRFAGAEGLQAIELATVVCFYQLTVHSQPPANERRYAEQRAGEDTILKVPCEPLPSPWTPTTKLTAVEMIS